MTKIEDFSHGVQKIVNRYINRPFQDAVPVLENWMKPRHGMTRNQLVWFEQYWRSHGTSQTETYRGRVLRKETVTRWGHRFTVWRDAKTGRFVKRQ